MNYHLDHKTAVVTGASRGIGLAIVQSLAREGVRVVAGARTVGTPLHEATPMTLEVDLSRPGGSECLIDYATAELGGIDLLVNNVGGTQLLSMDFSHSTTMTGSASLTSTCWARCERRCRRCWSAAGRS